MRHVRASSCSSGTMVATPLRPGCRSTAPDAADDRVCLDGQDAAHALRHARRWDIDTLFCNDCTEAGVFEAALDASVDGALVVLNCQARDVIDGMTYLVSLVEPGMSGRCLELLSLHLRFAISERGVTRADGQGTVAAFEVLHVLRAQRNLIRENSIHQLPVQMAVPGRTNARWWPDARPTWCSTARAASRRQRPRATPRARSNGHSSGLIRPPPLHTLLGARTERADRGARPRSLGRGGLAKAVRRSVEGTYLVRENDPELLGTSSGSLSSHVLEITREKTGDACARLAAEGVRVAALNSGNATYAGGGLLSARAQGRAAVQMLGSLCLPLERSR